MDSEGLIYEMAGIDGCLTADAGHDAHYYGERHCYIDCRGPLSIHPASYFGFGVKVITASHDLSTWPQLGKMILRPVVIDEGAWIASFAILFNCHIGEHAIVSFGAVVNGLNVPPWAVVTGNPAKIIGRMKNGVIIPWTMDEES